MIRGMIIFNRQMLINQLYKFTHFHLFSNYFIYVWLLVIINDINHTTVNCNDCRYTLKKRLVTSDTGGKHQKHRNQDPDLKQHYNQDGAM